MQSNNVHSKLAHIKSIRTPTLQKMLEALEWSSETKCKKNCASVSFEIGDYVELRREYYVSEIVRVQNFVQRGSETRFQVCPLNAPNSRMEAVPSEIFSISQMQQRILQELQQPDCLEATLELEAMEIFVLMNQLSGSTDEAATQESRSRRSRSRDEQTQHEVREPKTSHHRSSSARMDLTQTIDLLTDSPSTVKKTINIDTTGSKSTIERLSLFESDIKDREKIAVEGDRWTHQHDTYVSAIPGLDFSDPRENKRRDLSRAGVLALCLQKHFWFQGEYNEMETSTVDFLVDLFRQVPPSPQSPRILVLERESLFPWQNYFQKLVTGSVSVKELQRYRDQVAELRAKSPEVVAFAVCTGGHHYVCVLRLVGGVVEVLTIDSYWTGQGGVKNHVWQRPKNTNNDAPVLNLLNELNDNGTSTMVGHDSEMQYLLAVLAQIFWPKPFDQPRKVIQRFPLMPFQGLTHNCGVFTVYYLAALLVKPTEFLSAFEPKKRLVFGSGCGMQLRHEYVKLSEMATNAYDLSLEDFYEEVKSLSNLPVQVVEQTDENLMQQFSQPEQIGIRAEDLINTGTFPSLEIMEWVLKATTKLQTKTP